MRRIAIRGIVSLAAVICISIFFSGTIKSMTTAKVQLVMAKNGRIEENIRLEGRLTFPDTVELTMPGVGADTSLSIKTVYVGVGRWVEAGEPLFSAEVSGYQKLYDIYQTEFSVAQSDAFDIDRRLGSLRLTRTEELWLQAYDTLIADEQAVLRTETDLDVHDNLYGSDVQSEERRKLVEALKKAQEQRATAQVEFDKVNRLGINQELMQMVLNLRDAHKRMSEASEKITALRTLKEQVACVRAPHAGYVVSVPIKMGEVYSGQGPAMVMSADNPDNEGGVLRADLSGTDKRIEAGTKVVVSDGGREISAAVTNRGIDVSGSWYADVAVTRAQITEIGGAAYLMREGVNMTCTYRAQTSTTLLPVSAVRGSGDNRYVYIVAEQNNSLGETTLVVVKQEVHVIAETEDTVSIEEDLGRQRIAYMEDRLIDDGTEVMAYAQ